MKRPHSRATAALGLFGVALVIVMLPGRTAQAADDPTYQAARDLADKIQGITQGASGASDAKASTEPLAKVDPCTLMTDAEVRKFFPQAKVGQRERAREKYGLTACFWDHPGGRLALQLSLGATPGSSMEEAQGIAQGFVDPLKRSARKEVRYETIDGVGSEAVAVVEKADENRGILSNAAYLYTQRGDVQLMIMAVDLARGDRAGALKVLRDIGTIAARRL